jgi:tripartite ATP-independent transporter DctM subunit
VEWYWVLVLMLGMVVGFMALGLPVAFAFFFANIVGALIFIGAPGDRGAGLVAFVRGTVSSLANFTLAPIPLFILMGEILFHTGVAFAAVGAIERLIARVPGRLAVVSVASGTVFSALSGSTIANTAMLGNVLLPDMLKRGYHPTMAMGPIMAVGGIAMLIPPSALAVLLGSLAKIPIDKLLIGGILPGLMMSAFFVGYIVVRCWMNPALAPSEKPERLGAWARWRPFVVYVLPLFVIFAAVMGSIFAGIASPTDSAALGTVSAVLVALGYRKLTWKNLTKSLVETAKVTTMIFFIIAASYTFSQILAFSGATNKALDAILGFDLSPIAAVLIMIGILLFLGCFMDQVSMLLLTLPFFEPLWKALQIDPVWLGVLFLIAMELGLLTPPFGLLLFVMKGVAPKEIAIQAVYRAAFPFIGLEMAVLAILIAFPGLALYLPKLIN